jgi:hypothetical protein
MHNNRNGQEDKAEKSEDADVDSASESSDQLEVKVDSVVSKAKSEEFTNDEATTPTSSGPATELPKVLGFDLNMDLDENGEIAAAAANTALVMEKEEQEDSEMLPPDSSDFSAITGNVLVGASQFQGSHARPSLHPDEDDYDCEDEDEDV